MGLSCVHWCLELVWVIDVIPGGTSQWYWWTTPTGASFRLRGRLEGTPGWQSCQYHLISLLFLTSLGVLTIGTTCVVNYDLLKLVSLTFLVMLVSLTLVVLISRGNQSSSIRTCLCETLLASQLVSRLLRQQNCYPALANVPYVNFGSWWIFCKLHQPPPAFYEV